MSRKKPSRIRRADPFYERELARYEFPLPSREYVSQKLADEGRPVTFAELTELLDIAGSERETFQRRLGAMEREGQLMRNRKGAYILPERASLTAGKIQGHPDGAPPPAPASRPAPARALHAVRQNPTRQKP